MKHYIITSAQKTTINRFMEKIKYSKHRTRFEPIPISANRWVLPDVFKDNVDVARTLSGLSAAERTAINNILSSVECREIADNEQLISKP